MGATAAALTLYDMCKAMSHDITIESVRLLRKSGGKRDFVRATGEAARGVPRTRKAPKPRKASE
jgi:hypothetical protein